ncbi:hypothetical protein EB118_03025 [bacterium]|nr:hypothetical protein [bacterium]NDC93937.1 hypothetical protein [bacterium]NDD83432.1 hypothetical protein [bacterium]NDG29057.1 hypothetical protein [bacterium]
MYNGHIKEIILQQIRDHLRLPVKSSNLRFLGELYKHFRHHKSPDYIDILVFLTESNKVQQQESFFGELVRKCRLKTRVIKSTRDCINFPDLKYILSYSTIEQFTCILDHFVVPCSVISYCIKQLFYAKPKTAQCKAKHLIDHMFIKHCLREFSEADGMFLHAVLLDIIRHRETDLVLYFLQKKNMYRVSLSYQIIVNELLKLEYIEVIQAFYDEMRADAVVRDVRVIIDRDILRRLAERGSFKLLEIVIELFLGNAVLLQTYWGAIRKGLSTFLKKSSGTAVIPKALEMYLS